jgi:hypothetical protein
VEQNSLIIADWKPELKMSFEVFICYKELTGAPLAEKLREALKELGIKAFVAHMTFLQNTNYVKNGMKKGTKQ